MHNYLVLCGPDRPELDENLGYAGADLMLRARTLGLSTWWVGGTYSRRGVSSALLAPTALNRQGFYLVGRGSEVTLSGGSSRLARTDLGIVRYHFELGAGRESFTWS